MSIDWTYPSQLFLGLLLVVVIYFSLIFNKNRSKRSNTKKIDSRVAEEMAQKILEDAKMHRAARREENEKSSYYNIFINHCCCFPHNVI